MSSLALQACTDALAAISSTDIDDDDGPPLALILADVDALLALIYNVATKLALVAPSYHASIPVLTDLANYPPALAHCTRLLRPDMHGATLVKDIRSRAIEIIDALRALIQTLLHNAASRPAGGEYLVRIAALHDLITDARGPSGIPKDNWAAVHRAWKADRDTLEDNLQEIADMIRDAQSDHAADQSDDGWDDIGLSHTVSMDERELARANNVHHLLRLTTLLHKRISLDVLPFSSSAPVSALDALLAQSNLLLSTSDDLVAALYTTHDPPYIRSQILRLADITTSFHSQLPVFLSSIDDKHCALSNEDGNSKKKADKKWFDTCVDQIRRSCSTATE